jgi:hypothetical protein
MKTLAVVLTGIALLLVVVIASASVANGVAPAQVPHVKWTPVIAVQLAAATLANKDVPPPPDDTPTPPDDTPKPHPDVDKCACKGTGVITHGDGHKTPCPYHGDTGERKWRCQCDKPGYYCVCIKTYGKCACDKSTTTSTTSDCANATTSRSDVSRRPSALKLFVANLFGGRRR